VTNQEQIAPSPFRDRAVSYLEVPATDIAQSSTLYHQVFGWAVSSDAEQGSFTDGSGHVIGHWRSDLEVAGDQASGPTSTSRIWTRSSTRLLPTAELWCSLDTP